MMKPVKDGLPIHLRGLALLINLSWNCIHICQSLRDKWRNGLSPSSKRPYLQATIFTRRLGLTIWQLAARLSKSHFTREFKKATGFTPIHYLTNIRLEKAETLLKTTKYSIEEIAIQCGYRNANYLNKVFRKKIGMSPKQLRETSDA
ncbi:helix-turn-helix domain-containing protein [Bacillus sp. 4A_MP2]